MPQLRKLRLNEGILKKVEEKSPGPVANAIKLLQKDVFIVNSENCTEKTERWESPITKGIVVETEAEN